MSNLKGNEELKPLLSKSEFESKHDKNKKITPTFIRITIGFIIFFIVVLGFVSTSKTEKVLFIYLFIHFIAIRLLLCIFKVYHEVELPQSSQGEYSLFVGF